MKILLITLILISSLFASKEVIVKEIDSITIKEIETIYLNVLDKLIEEGNIKALNYLTDRENAYTILLNYKDMLEAIAYNESNFKYLIGFKNKNDISYFQINIANKVWNVEKLSSLTKKTVSKERLLDDIRFSAKIALHILIYNIGIHANYNKYNPDMYNMIASYHNPTKINHYYKNNAKDYLNKER